MSTLPLSEELVRTLSLTLVITSVLAMEFRRLKFSAVAYVVQALLIVALLVSFATVNPALYWWAGTAFITKAVLIPWFLFRYIRRTQEMEEPPLVGFGPSVVVAAVLMIGFFRLTHSQVDLLATSPLAREEVFRTNLAVASTVFVLGLYSLLTRRDAVKLVIALCLLENGVHLSLVSLAPGLPETALFGIASEVVVTVFILLLVIEGVYREFGTTDTFRLRELQR
ncbi:MAG: NADH-quinone oxidoreductase subunit K [Longimicrobiales bacterium]|nr:NADH-quinone oxidoreductase subunit K [Longimicrobiales bacterium]